MSVHRSIGRYVVPSVLALLGALSFVGPARASDWEWTITPYAWLSDVGVDVVVNDREVTDTDVGFDDVVAKLDMALLVHVEGQNGKHGVLFDLTYMDLGNDSTEEDLPGLLPGTAELKADLSLALVELGGTYTPSGDGTGIGFLYGARIVDSSLELDVDFSSPLIGDRGYQTSGTLIDAMIGVRYLGRLSERWSLHLRGDVSAGGTDLTWNAIAGVGCALGETGRYTALAGYRYMSQEFKEDDQRAEVEIEGVFSGGFVALAIGL